MVTNENNMLPCPFCGRKNKYDSDLCMFCGKAIGVINHVNKQKMPVYHDDHVDNVTYTHSVFWYRFFSINFISIFPIVLLFTIFWFVLEEFKPSTNMHYVLLCLASFYLVTSVIGLIFFGMNMVFKCRMYTIARAVTIICSIIGAVLPLIFF